MTERLKITNGRIVRPGFYRNADDAGQTYTKTVSTGALDLDCVFCPDSIRRRNIEVIDKIGGKVLGIFNSWSFFVIQAQPAYAHFDAQRVVDHKLIIPTDHIESEAEIPSRARRIRDEYIRERELSADAGTAVQSYTRSEWNPSKSVGHLHTHLLTLSLAPLSRFSFDIDHGVTEAEFIEPTQRQIDAVERTRRQIEI